MNKLLIPFLLITLNIHSQNGCTDPLANNYDSFATINDGSCTYDPTSTTVDSSTELPSVLNETSGLVVWNSEFWSHNDSGSDINLYSTNTPFNTISKTIPLTGEANTDWEALEQDDDYLYLGDFGNNDNGNRTDLKVLKINKSTLTESNADIDYINFNYKNQTDLSPQSGNTTNFDCEAMIIDEDYLYLFSKEWTSNQTTIYQIPNQSGNQEAIKIDSYNINGLVTDAIYIKELRLITLIGYTNVTFQPFIYLLYDFTGNNFFNGNKRLINLNLPLHQVEAITSTDGLNYTITSEEVIKQPFINIPAKIHEIDLSQYLENYINNQTLDYKEVAASKIAIFPNPTSDSISIEGVVANIPYTISSTTGQIVKSGKHLINKTINIKDLPSGIYFLKFENSSIIHKIIRK